MHALNIRQNYPTWDNDIHKRKPRAFQFFKRIMYCRAQFKTTFVVFVSKTATRKRKLHVIPVMSFVCSQWGEKSNIYCYDYRLIVTFFAHLKSISMCLCFYTIATITAVFLDSRVYSLYSFFGFYKCETKLKIVDWENLQRVFAYAITLMMLCNWYVNLPLFLLWLW